MFLQQNSSRVVRDFAKKINLSKSNVSANNIKLTCNNCQIRKMSIYREKYSETPRKTSLKLYRDVMVCNKRCILMNDENFLKTDLNHFPD